MTHDVAIDPEYASLRERYAELVVRLRSFGPIMQDSLEYFRCHTNVSSDYSKHVEMVMARWNIQIKEVLTTFAQVNCKVSVERAREIEDEHRWIEATYLVNAANVRFSMFRLHDQKTGSDKIRAHCMDHRNLAEQAARALDIICSNKRIFPARLSPAVKAEFKTLREQLDGTLHSITMELGKPVFTHPTDALQAQYHELKLTLDQVSAVICELPYAKRCGQAKRRNKFARSPDPQSFSPGYRALRKRFAACSIRYCQLMAEINGHVRKLDLAYVYIPNPARFRDSRNREIAGMNAYVDQLIRISARLDYPLDEKRIGSMEQTFILQEARYMPLVTFAKIESQVLWQNIAITGKEIGETPEQNRKFAMSCVAFIHSFLNSVMTVRENPCFVPARQEEAPSIRERLDALRERLETELAYAMACVNATDFSVGREELLAWHDRLRDLPVHFMKEILDKLIVDEALSANAAAPECAEAGCVKHTDFQCNIDFSSDGVHFQADKMISTAIH